MTFDKYLAADCDEIRAALREHCSGRWHWDRIDCCLTGKDADLEWHGQQGVEVKGADDEYAYCMLHIGVTVAGHDVCLAREYETDAEYETAVDQYLESAQEIVCGSPLTGGEWTGGDWYLYGSYNFRVPLAVNARGDWDYSEIASEIVALAHENAEPIETKLGFMNDALNSAAGYTTED